MDILRRELIYLFSVFHMGFPFILHQALYTPRLPRCYKRLN